MLAALLVLRGCYYERYTGYKPTSGKYAESQQSWDSSSRHYYLEESWVAIVPENWVRKLGFQLQQGVDVDVAKTVAKAAGSAPKAGRLWLPPTGGLWQVPDALHEAFLGAVTDD